MNDKQHVLLIEPNQPLAKLYTAALEQAGYSVAVAGDAQKAIAAADKTRPSVVVIELQLPGHSGIEFLYEFRSYPDWAAVPVVLHTLVPPEQLKVSKFVRQHLGIVSYLYKPSASLEKLARAVELATVINLRT